jgi:serpin B
MFKRVFIPLFSLLFISFNAPLRAGGEFPWKVLAELEKGPEENWVYSPASMALAFGMLYGGARGETAAELEQFFEFSDQDSTHAGMKRLLNVLAAAGEHDDIELRAANRLWIQEQFFVEQEFLELTREFYKAVPELVDFRQNPDAIREAINQWVEEYTAERIKNLLPTGSVDALARLILVNALYFKSPWASTFEEAATQEQDFRLASGEPIQVPMMYQTGTFRGKDLDGFSLIELPLKDRRLSFLVILPDLGKDIDALALQQRIQQGEFSLNPQDWDHMGTVLRMPRFRVESELDLTSLMGSMGVQILFNSGQTDLSGISADGDLFVSGAFQKAFIEVVEGGVEAAAATAIVVRATSMPIFEREFSVNRPFYYAVRENTTGSLLFLGHVGRPQFSEVAESPAEPAVSEELAALRRLLGDKVVAEKDGYQTPIGFLRPAVLPWVEHENLGMVYLSLRGDELWFWSPAIGWLWTRTEHTATKQNPAIFPVFRRDSDGGWIRIVREARNPGWYYDYQTGGWGRLE